MYVLEELWLLLWLTYGFWAFQHWKTTTASRVYTLSGCMCRSILLSWLCIDDVLFHFCVVFFLGGLEPKQTNTNAYVLILARWKLSSLHMRVCMYTHACTTHTHTHILVPRPSGTFQRCTQRIGMVWLISWRNDYVEDTVSDSVLTSWQPVSFCQSKCVQSMLLVHFCFWLARLWPQALIQ